MGARARHRADRDRRRVAADRHAARVRRRRLPRRGLPREGGHARASRRAPAAAAARRSAARAAAGGQPGTGVRPLWQVIADVARALGHDPGDFRTGAQVSRRLFEAVPFYDGHHARGDRRPRRALGRARRSSISPAWEPAKLDIPGGAPAAARRQAAARHLPPAVGGQGGRPLAGAALHPRPPDRRALAGRRRTRSASARATASRSATARACARTCRLRAAVPAGSVFLAEGTREDNANVLTRGARRGPPRRRRLARAERRRGADPARRRGPGRDAAVRAAADPAAGGHMSVFAEVGYYEPWWMQIAEGDRDLLRRLQPRAARAARRPQGARPLPAPLRPEPRRPVRRCCRRSPTSASSSSRRSSARRTPTAGCSRSRPVISMMTAAATIAIIPFSDVVDIFGTPTGLYGVDPSIGILFAFAFGGIAFYGLMLGGWASGSKYSFLGSMRAAAQLISYEVAQGLSLVGVIMMVGSLSMTDIVQWQEDELLDGRPAVRRLPDLHGRRLRRDQPRAVRPRRGRRRAGRRLQHGVRRRPLRRVLRGGVPEHGRRLRR